MSVNITVFVIFTDNSRLFHDNILREQIPWIRICKICYCASACSAPTVEEVDEENEFLTRADKEKNMAIDERMLELYKAIIVEYKTKYSSFSLGGRK
jgi:hypothetical protein